MIEHTKITLLICLTSLVICILALSYNDYHNRFSIISMPDNAIYIFDKKSAILNRCINGECQIVNTKFPNLPFWGNGSVEQKKANDSTPQQAQSQIQQPTQNQTQQAQQPVMKPVVVSQ